MWKYIYEGISDEYFTENDIFNSGFLKNGKKHRNMNIYIPKEIKVKIKMIVIENKFLSIF